MRFEVLQSILKITYCAGHQETRMYLERPLPHLLGVALLVQVSQQIEQQTVRIGVQEDVVHEHGQVGQMVPKAGQ